MSVRFSKALVLTSGIIITVVLAIFGALMIDWERSAERAKKDTLLARTPSPDLRYVAEIHAATTAMHGGPGKIYVSLSKRDSPFADTVYERTYECDDSDAFRVRWNSARELLITYGSCDPSHDEGKGPHSDYYYKQQNTVWRSDLSWQEVKIIYQDSGHVATY